MFNEIFFIIFVHKITITTHSGVCIFNFNNIIKKFVTLALKTVKHTIFMEKTTNTCIKMCVIAQIITM